MAWKTQADDTCKVSISKDSYVQTLDFIRVPALMINGEVTSWRWDGANLEIEEEVFEYRGLTKEAAYNVKDQTATRVVAGNFQYESFSRKVSRRRANEAGGWTVTVTEKTATLNPLT